MVCYFSGLTATYAAAFSLYSENSTVAIGNFSAGIAAEVADASTAWYNPAGLTLIKKQQLVVSGVGVFPKGYISGTSTYSTPNFPSYTENISHLNAAKNGLVSDIYYALPLGEKSAFSFSIVVPYGLATGTNNSSPLRYAGTFSEFGTFNFFPALATTITDWLSVGGAVDIQYSLFHSHSVFGSPNTLQAINYPPNYLDSHSVNKLSSTSVGFHAGFLIVSPNKRFRIGFNYLSPVAHTFRGTSRLSGPLADPTLNILNPSAAGNLDSTFAISSLQTNAIKFPMIATLSSYLELTPQWTLLGSVLFTQWSVFKTFEYSNLAGASVNSSGQVTQVPITSTQEKDYRDTWTFSIGGNYKINEKLLFRCGTGYDPTPTINRTRSVNVPDFSRIALAVGGHYQLRPQLGIDIGYTHLFASHPAVLNNTTAFNSSSFNVNKQVTGYANLVGLQAVWNIT